MEAHLNHKISLCFQIMSLKSHNTTYDQEKKLKSWEKDVDKSEKKKIIMHLRLAGKKAVNWMKARIKITRISLGT